MVDIKRMIKGVINYFRFLRGNVVAVDFHRISLNADISESRLAAWVQIGENARINKSTLGRYTSIGRGTKITHSEIGGFCAISWDCTINALFHPLDRMTVSAIAYVPEFGNFVSVREQAYQTVVIGNDVWIGAQAIIMPGVKIGDGAVIGAGSIVTKDVKPYEIVCGNPARHLRWRLGEQERELMKRLCWWDWSDQKIKDNIDYFRAPVNVDMFGSNT